MAPLCLHSRCAKQPTYNFEGIKPAVYCRKHAKDDMVNVSARRCLHKECRTQPSFNVEGRKSGAYCLQHAKNGMVNVKIWRCSHPFCRKRASFNFEMSKTTRYCNEHAEDGMVDVRSRTCSRVSCARFARYYTEGSMEAVYCKQHAEIGMVCVWRCSHDNCQQRPRLTSKRMKPSLYCQEHAENGMEYTAGAGCIRGSCGRTPLWGMLADGVATACSHHTAVDASGSVINFGAHCRAAGCSKHAKWGPAGKQPTHCPDHGPLVDGLVCTIKPAGNRKSRSSSVLGPSNRAMAVASSQVKPECAF